MPTKTATAKPAKVVTPTKPSRSRDSSDIVYKDDEVPFKPYVAHHYYKADDYYRKQTLIEPPASFDGTLGTYEAGIDKNGREFYFKVDQNPLFKEPKYIHGCQSQVHGRIFGKDSSKTQAFKDATKADEGKYRTYRERIDWEAEESSDLGLPLVDFAEIVTESGKAWSVLIVELKSKKPIDEGKIKSSHGLTRNKYTAPAPVPGVNTTDGYAQAAEILERLMKQGFNLDEIASQMKRGREDAKMEGEDERKTKK